ncbi:proline/glycine betaine ABC transporter permease [Endozoicomonas sp. SM1973]|uniref:Proline/glycine betaine ABC transporter permease n=1 Tax=Spartinivicinus marinus TaxID=2994442 RepID=A0A853I658_9GAMM|nr:proline/glycine betaine ABC transporter permease [Spartinivicinus marinus]MCX4029473.1 proline/glycine betaine ABC transporter permease [Spartinivicinus marinus]NYZ65047.1 proline/glycine betaine ABC transporter permease [Spartinivicinus marinus]
MASIDAGINSLPNKTKELAQLKQFLVHSSSYYSQQFNQLVHGKKLSFNTAAVLFGPLWAAYRNIWVLFWLLSITDVIGLVIIGRSLWGSEKYPEANLMMGISLLVMFRLLGGLVANQLYYAYFKRWRVNTGLQCGVSRKRIGIGCLLILATYPLTIYQFTATHIASFLETFPTSRKIAAKTALAIDHSVDWMISQFEGMFDNITAAIREVLNFLELIFIGTPWPVMALLLLLLAWRAAGWKVVAFTAAALAYLGFFGFWNKAMSTMALVAASVFICFIVGTPLGILAARKPRFNAVLTPILDLMQTMPSFVYLIPAIAFFSIGKPPAVLATVIFAMPPMIRLTTLGIKQVPDSVIETMLAFGATSRQILFKAELPLAIPSIMTGINQSIMMSLSMVVVAALIGAGGLGYDVLFSLQHLEAGKGLLAGIAIVLCAMILDRIVQGKRK